MSASRQRGQAPQRPGLAARVGGVWLTCAVILGVVTDAQAQEAPCGAALAGARRISAGASELAWVALPTPIPVGRHFELEIHLCGAARMADLRVDADMPAHRHGMNYRPTLQRLGPGRWRAQGLMFHMPGQWRLSFELDEAGRRTRLTDTVDLP